ncbi:aspartic proteinase-like protein 1 isoform X2 [Magnolia sinica]|uniref:aspartic proteinase-like protein 1 isoform X2 n=1 Tax=Magnolia sinica TaxID=86752 RepID=UPI002658450D|nr:aspartic proteinase-like protein 1 isoform X2 [Magnolia sinica]
MAARSIVSLLLTFILIGNARSLTFSSKLIHRLSDEAKAIRVSRNGGILAGSWPMRRSMEYYQILVRSDLERTKLKLNPKYQSLFPSEGSETVSFGNDFGWCSLVFGASIMQDRDLSVYSPSGSSTSKHLSCSHELCSLGPKCKSPKQPCPYNVDYYSENTSSSGLLVEDTLYLASSGDHASTSTAKTPVIIGCGMTQSGGYLDGIAPDGLLGLGFGDVSVPSFLAKAGLVRNSFSLCFDDDDGDSGRIFFGDQGSSAQQSTPFLEWEGKYLHYIIGVDGFCIGPACLKQTGFQAMVDSGSSFTFLPDDVYDTVAVEFDRQMNTSRFRYEGSPWEYCYKASSLDLPKIPTVTLRFSGNNSFEVHNPIFPYYGKEGELAGFCLALQSAGEDALGTIGQNLMMGYRIVFDREKLKLGWSRSKCRDLDDGTRVSLTPPPHDRPENPLPTNEQQSNPGGRAVSPAVAGRTPHNPSAATPLVLSWQTPFLRLLLLFLAILILSN